ncbi:NUDIX hydrolase [Propionibacterium australiense]|uniref:NUDIX domain-containing protein n=1 Tax=Propionibacterium australiense TaxID=119981 RepID=A0A383S5H9_9ACTN|nr:NUDIX domain-containing protein [Propionibacterium australiense]RLP09755.1 NUDIX domain-containing protein [Propionibacterium australiense]RLP10190.1 NUDIX domain-containing protein [Propionibacterium australiense]SYZ33230.1 NUDIX hydrolase domain [Propionibacterium australiense]VEH89278.1 dihydroneopterin triphosphate pyrophosphatase [Propionibacterium australiense]
MATPEYVLRLREKIGHDLLLLPGVCAVIVRENAGEREVLLVRRADNGQWTPVTGIADPGEDADTAAVRETLEETGVRIEVDRVTWIETLEPQTYANGDRCQFFDTCLLAHPVGGEARVGDEESTEVRWFPVSALPPMKARFERKVAHALSGDPRVLIGADGR